MLLSDRQTRDKEKNNKAKKKQEQCKGDRMMNGIVKNRRRKNLE
jgi:hypothetical protein